MQGNIFFTKMDLASAFHQVDIDPASRQFFAFRTETDGNFHFKKMPFGFVNAPGIFQSAMEKILAKEISAGFCVVYLDDIIVFAKTQAEHDRRVVAVLERLAEADLHASIAKCIFGVTELEVLGYYIKEGGAPASLMRIPWRCAIYLCRAISESYAWVWGF